MGVVRTLRSFTWVMGGKCFTLVVVILAILSGIFVHNSPGNIWGTATIQGRELHFTRDPSGVMVSKTQPMDGFHCIHFIFKIITGNGDLDFILGLGYAHAHDRLIQMLLQRAVGRSQLSLLKPGAESLKIDKLFKKMNFEGKYKSKIGNQLVYLS